MDISLRRAPALLDPRRFLAGSTALVNALASTRDSADARRQRELLGPDREPVGPGQVLRRLPDEDCWDRLRHHAVGRFGCTAHSGVPVIVPVNYVVDGSRIVLRSGRGPKLSAASRGDVVAFEIDAIDQNGRAGWSVVAIGRARLVREPAERAKLARLDLEPWAAGPRDDYIVIDVTHLDGRVLPARREEA